MHTVKEKIKTIINDIPDEALEDVLKYLETLKNKSRDKISLSQDLSKILEEDKRLLERLAK